MKPQDKDYILNRNEEAESGLERNNTSTKRQDADDGKDYVLSTSQKNITDEGEMRICETSQTAGGNTVIVLKICSRIAQIGRNNNIDMHDKHGDEDSQNEDIDENNKVIPNRSEIRRPGDTVEQRSQEIEPSEQSTCSDSPMTRRERHKKPRSRKSQFIINIIPVCKSIGPSDRSPSCKLFFEISDEVMKKLQMLRDNGEWDSFEKATIRMREKKGCTENNETSLVIELEQSMAVCYQNNLEESERIILDVIKKSENIENSSHLKRRAYIYLSVVYRKMGSKTGNADEHTEKAEKIGAEDLGSKTLDSTFESYERASVLMDFMTTCTVPTVKSRMKEIAKANLKKCIDVSLALEEDTSKQRYVKKNQFALIKIAMLALDCRTPAARQKDSVSQSDIDEAKDSLAALRRSYWDDMAQGEKLQYFLAMADLNWRQKNFSEAHSFASEALAMAKALGFGTEIKPAKDRLTEIQLKLQDFSMKHSATEKNGVSMENDYCASASDSDFTDGHFGGSSCYETDDSLSALP